MQVGVVDHTLSLSKLLSLTSCIYSPTFLAVLGAFHESALD